MVAKPGVADSEAASANSKLVPLVLSTSTHFAPQTYPSGCVRFPFAVGPSLRRWRLHVQNRNQRLNKSYRSGAAFLGLWVGERDGASAAFAESPTQVLPPFVLPPGGREYVSQWITTPSMGGGRTYLLSLGWRDAPGLVTRSPAGCFQSKVPEAASSATGHHFRAERTCPFSWWLEVEVDAEVPVVAVWGDSLSCGTGNDLPVHDSPISQYSRRVGALPYHASYPGSTMAAWEAGGNNAHAWRRWKDLARPDVVIHFMGQNDLLKADVEEMRDRFTSTLTRLREHVCASVYLGTLTPTARKTGEQHAIRREYNAWLRSRPGGALGVFDFSGAVGNPADEALMPPYDSGDRLHLSRRGSTALADAIQIPGLG